MPMGEFTYSIIRNCSGYKDDKSRSYVDRWEYIKFNSTYRKEEFVKKHEREIRRLVKRRCYEETDN